MPSKTPHVTAANHYRTLEVIRRQHTAIHHIVESLEHGGSALEVKRNLAQIIAALAMAQAELS